MPQCLALTAKGKRCRSCAPYESYVCSKHTEHFKDAELAWFYNQGKLLRNLELFPGFMIYVKEALRHKLIVPTIEDIAKLPAHSFYTYFFLLCAKHLDGFALDWNPSLSTKAIRTLWKWHGSIGPVQITYEDIFAIMRLRPVDNFYPTICLYPHGLVPERPWFKFFYACAKQEWFEELLHSNRHPELIQGSIEYLNKHCSVNPNHISLLRILQSGNLEKWLGETKQTRYTVLKGRLGPIRDELFTVSWSPERYMRWCLDEEEKDRLRVFWSLDPNKVEGGLC
jgi:hypothetical protein